MLNTARPRKYRDSTEPHERGSVGGSCRALVRARVRNGLARGEKAASQRVERQACFGSCRTSYRSSEKYLGFRCFPLILVETPLRLYTWRLECERFDASCHRSPCCFTDHFTGILDTQTILHVNAMCFATRRAFETSETRYLPTRKGWTSPAASRSTASQCLSHSSWKTLPTCLKRTAFGVLSQVTVCSVKTLVLAQTLHSSVDLVLGGSWTSWISSLPSQSFRRRNTLPLCF